MGRNEPSLGRSSFRVGGEATAGSSTSSVEAERWFLQVEETTHLGAQASDTVFALHDVPHRSSLHLDVSQVRSSAALACESKLGCAREKPLVFASHPACIAEGPESMGDSSHFADNTSPRCTLLDEIVVEKRDFVSCSGVLKCRVDARKAMSHKQLGARPRTVYHLHRPTNKGAQIFAARVPGFSIVLIARTVHAPATRAP